MDIYLMKDQRKLGPYSVEQVQIFLRQGLVAITDEVWCDSWPSWLPISDVPRIGFQPMTQRASSVVEDSDVSLTSVEIVIPAVTPQIEEPSASEGNDAAPVEKNEISSKPTDNSIESDEKLGHRYFDGDGITQDYDKAYSYFCKAAKSGNPNAQNMLGKMYKDGLGVKKDSFQAFAWIQKAAEQGYSHGEFNLGCMYQNGWGAAKNYQEAYFWYEKAASQGHAKSQIALGFMCEKGLGVSQDVIKAVVLYKEAEKQGEPEAKNALMRLGYNPEGRDRAVVALMLVLMVCAVLLVLVLTQ